VEWLPKFRYSSEVLKFKVKVYFSWNFKIKVYSGPSDHVTAAIVKIGIGTELTTMC
jgi:hypothetical protein